MARPLLWLGAPALAVAILWAAAPADLGAKTEISVKVEKTFDFTAVRSWAWHPDGGGDVLMAVTADDDPEAVKQRIDPIIVPAVERELAQKGLAAAPAAQASVYVHY